MNKKQKKRIWSIVKGVGKISITALAIYWLHSKIDFSQVFNFLGNMNLWVFIATLSLTMLATLIAAHRLKLIFNAHLFAISTKTNLRLYLLGLFYNMFFPGGIGGDGYKAYLINRLTGKSLKKTLLLIVYDRSAGVIAFLWLSALVSYNFFPFLWASVLTICCFFGTIVYFGLYMKRFKIKNNFFQVLCCSFLIHILIGIAFVLLLYQKDFAFNASGYLFSYWISTLTLMIPLSIGGLGIRELFLLYIAQYINIDHEIVIGLSLMLYFINLIIALGGGFFVFFPRTLNRELKAKAIH